MTKTETETIILRGILTRLHFASPKKTAGLITDEQGTTHSFCGTAYLTADQVGQFITLAGESWGEYNHRPQFITTAIVTELPTDVYGLASYLASHPAFRGLGTVKAKRLARHFGQALATALTDSPEEVADVAGVTPATVTVWAAAYNEITESAAVASQLSAHGLTPKQIEKLVSVYGNSTLNVLQADPYVLIEHLDNFGFARADEIARKWGVPKDHPGRIRHAILHTLREQENDGNTITPVAMLLTKAGEKLALDTENQEAKTRDGFQELTNSLKITLAECAGEPHAGRTILYNLETDLLNWIGAARPNPSAARLPTPDLAPDTDGNVPDATQAAAIAGVLGAGIAVITGGAGSGKTFLIRRVLAAYKSAGLHFRLCAPTGKAAIRMTEATGEPAQTVHRMLGYNPNGFTYGPPPKYLKLEDTPALVVVDESSMADVELAWQLVGALDLTRTALLLVGDPHQIPSVGPGSILRDLIARAAVDPAAAPVYTLAHCHRQAGPLKINSAAVLTGAIAPTVPGDPIDPSPWTVSGRAAHNDQSAAADAVVTEYLAAVTAWGRENVQVLAPMYKGEIGIDELNRRLQTEMIGGPAVATDSRRFHVGDRVINLKNNYATGIMNGMIGYIADSHSNGKVVTVQFEGMDETEPTEYGGGEPNPPLANLKLAYCISIHKSQGSQWPAVIVVSHKSHAFMWHRNLIYTAITRAAKSVVIIGDSWGIRYAASSVVANDRRTWWRLWGKAKVETE